MIVAFRGRPANEQRLSGIFLRNSNVGAHHNSRRRCGNKRHRLGPQHACVAPRNYRLAGIKYLKMICVALTDAAYDAIASTLPKGAARWPMQRDRGQCFIQVEAAVIDRMRAMRRPGESYSEIILRLVELKTSDVN